MASPSSQIKNWESSDDAEDQKLSAKYHPELARRFQMVKENPEWFKFSTDPEIGTYEWLCLNRFPEVRHGILNNVEIVPCQEMDDGFPLGN